MTTCNDSSYCFHIVSHFETNSFQRRNKLFQREKQKVSIIYVIEKQPINQEFSINIFNRNTLDTMFCVGKA